ncbi:haloacid dehalogenase-like hydrolase (HAD) superfamily protein [Klebsormidium nitens]|uniref:Haloacid dehalogenase-like hydrolase (HAD) superfamily protein n=1 Tax=Klebsormidium nitens TaxID=105231 RepID=A0A1Y1I4C7_KLENI|nr:haloacid dehalogenase-like hydrolase (HAD) superfamily protein [Klebsormidium nitens]|eukprot:GAQ85785.1 haloacid dehalogenase-like hydrolase (HAD) superfamily protein [Klebsormidium nitens]
MHSPIQKGQCSVSDYHPCAQTVSEVQDLDGLRHVADDYKVWLLDQFGVLHDGRKAYPGTVDAVRQLAERGAQLLIISNSSKRASVTISKLGPLGFDPAWFVGAITSGELTHKYLKERTDPFFASLGHKCVHFTWSARQAVSTHGLGLTVVQHPEDADFILAHGSEAIGVAGPRAGGENDLDPPATPAPLSVMEDVMKRAVQKAIPMIVANPDEVTVDGRDLAIMPGTLGKMYERMGGHVQWMGKPDPVIYQAAGDMLGADLRSVVAVGDSLHHDIGGAAAAGVDSIFVAGGIHAADLGVDAFGGKPEPSRLVALIREKDARTPKFCLPLFNW